MFPNDWNFQAFSNIRHYSRGTPQGDRVGEVGDVGGRGLLAVRPGDMVLEASVMLYNDRCKMNRIIDEYI